MSWRDPMGRAFGSVAFTAVLLYVVYNVGVVAMQTASRALELEGKVSESTVLVYRFIWFTVAVVAAMLAINFCRAVMARVMKRPRAYVVKFRPAHIPASIGQAVTQGGQTACIVSAAGLLTGQFQSNLSLIILPIWTVVVEIIVWSVRMSVELSRAGKEGRDRKVIERPSLKALLGSAAYGLIGTFTIGGGSLGNGSIGLGIGLMVASGFFTAWLQQFTQVSVRALGKQVRKNLRVQHPEASEDELEQLFKALPDREKKESSFTTALWQNGLPAVLLLPLLFTPVAGLEQAELVGPASIGWKSFLILLAVPAFSLAQQVALYGSLRIAPDETLPKSRLALLRGSQVILGGFTDAAFFSVRFTGGDWLVSAVIFVTMIATFRFAGRRKQKGGDDKRS
jgi:hypothetical protein